ncbi:MAG: DegT/DnrJ/EryC1/StrS family aminotransferase [Planctomycetes bacterium]|nr:DegT/DnrJ/EryC1/StrS family aminotransferase [Planctomycetota bacterium]
MKVQSLDLRPQHEKFQRELEDAILRVVRSTIYINGPDVAEFEKDVADWLGVRHAIGVSSGTDALLAALMALELEPGDEVITTPFTFFATAGCTHRAGLRPKFVDIEEDSFNIDPAKLEDAITPRTRAIIPVHLFGQNADMPAVTDVARRRGITVIEDIAQSMGATFEDHPLGTLSEIQCFSFFPSKNLGGLGDGGLVTTNDSRVAELVRNIRNHGAQVKYFHERVGGNFRLDTIQAAALRVKLKHVGSFIEGRRRVARKYDELFARADLNKFVVTPKEVHGRHTYNQYVIRARERRDELQKFLAQNDVSSAIYYPLGLHEQECFAYLGHKKGDFPVTEKVCREVLALPVYPELDDASTLYVASKVAEFFRS